MKSSNYLQQVKEQYENFPYPERDPEDEKRRLFPPVTDCLDRMNFYCFEGRRRYDAGFRVLVAGGGTGDATVFLAEQLRDTGSEVVYLDISTASMEVAKSRASIRGLKNITWVQGSLLDLPELGLGLFDYINCSGVLHHLEHPQQGLAALNSVLKDDGAMAIMVYAKYGRTAIYQIQDLMRRINKGEPDLDVQVENCSKILAAIPDSNWFNHSRRLFPDWEIKRPIELYDLFLHSQDRAYSIPELYDFVGSQGLQILHLLPSGDPLGNRLYQPDSYITDKEMLDRVKGMSIMEQQAIAELMHGMIHKHTFYVAREARRLPSPEDAENIPFLDIHSDRQSYASISAAVQNSNEAVQLRNNNTGFSVRFSKTPYTEALFKYIDGAATLGEIYKKIIGSPKYKKHRPTIPALKAEFGRLFSELLVHEWMFLRHQSIQHPPTIPEMQARISEGGRS